MHASERRALPARLQALVGMAHLLERLERSPRSASPEQFRAVARQVCRLLEEAAPDDDLDIILRAYPATAELYENLRYEHAGLCRSDFEPSLQAEMAAVSLIQSARRR